MDHHLLMMTTLKLLYQRLLPTQLADLHALYDPLSPDDNFSVDLFLNVLQFVESNPTA